MAKLSRMSRVVLIVVGAGTLATAPARLPAQTPAPAGPQEARVVGVFLDPSGGRPAVVLQGKRDNRSFAMSIGAAEATGIAFPLENRVPPRPLTHDLFLTMFGRLKVTVTADTLPDVLTTGVGWWRPDAPAPHFGGLDININAAMSYSSGWDLASGSADTRGIPCRILPV